MIASSFFDANHAPWLARLHRTRIGASKGAWVARHRNHGQWIQIDLGRPMRITGIATQGRQDANQWVRQYWLKFSQDALHFTYVTEYGNYKVGVSL